MISSSSCSTAIVVVVVEVVVVSNLQWLEKESFDEDIETRKAPLTNKIYHHHRDQ